MESGVDARKCLLNSYNYENPNGREVNEVLDLKETPCDAYANYSEAY